MFRITKKNIYHLFSSHSLPLSIINQSSLLSPSTDYLFYLFYSLHLFTSTSYSFKSLPLTPKHNGCITLRYKFNVSTSATRLSFSDLIYSHSVTSLSSLHFLYLIHSFIGVVFYGWIKYMVITNSVIYNIAVSRLLNNVIPFLYRPNFCYYAAHCWPFSFRCNCENRFWICSNAREDVSGLLVR